MELTADKVADMDNIFIESGAQVVRNYKSQEPLIIADENTYAVAGDKVAHLLDEKTDLLLVGTGVINDITKYVSHRVNIPEVLVATAPSMDGFVSDTAAPTVGNLKSSFPCNLPRTILGDTDILKDSPEVMIPAGFGDIIGKYSALTGRKLNRWRSLPKAPRLSKIFSAAPMRRSARNMSASRTN